MVSVVVLGMLLVLCLAGGVAAYFALRGEPASTASPSPVAAASASPSPLPRPSVAPAACLIGSWRETSYTANWEMYGNKIQFTGAGTLMRIDADGTMATVDKVTRRGAGYGDRYEVIHNGTTKLNYVADDKTINYSSPRTTGTTTLKVNGRQRASEPLKATITPETYSCKDDRLRLFGDVYSSEWERILPPGRPVQGTPSRCPARAGTARRRSARCRRGGPAPTPPG
ncbi:hypothetical protein Cci01nite_18440 [Catellatospora citrea]|uniref:Uncharacterized protein n=1 Tax=Catellatospora citrea TaxID=53366 RepID=A0A8J3KGK1_9ACTN|nr:hypothetical protein C8E86_6207 [Catellatospora citrea]GIF96750.1 hypothetical protein Cci01nite_18440 [Catellatospora citrea]